MQVRQPSLEMGREEQIGQSTRDEDTFRPLAKSVIDYAVFVVGSDGRVHTWSQEAERLLGYTAAEVVGYPYDRFFTPEDLCARTPRRDLDQALAAGFADVDRWHVRRDGTRFWSSGLLTLLRDADGSMKGFAKVMRDRTALREGQDTSPVAEERYQAVLEDMTDAVCRVRADRVIVFANAAFGRLVGRSPAELIGRLGPSVAHPDDVPRVEAALATLSADNPIVRVENRVVDTGGGVRWVEFVNRGFFDPGGELIEFQAVGRDMTDRLQMESRIREAERLEAVGRLAGGIAHEFNNLLTVIQGFAQMLLGEVQERNPSRTFLVEIDKAATRAAVLTRQLLAFSRRQIVQPRVLDLNAAVTGLAETLRATLAPEVTLVTHLAPKVGWVRLDPSQVEEVITSLIASAGEAMPGGGILTVSTRDEALEPGGVRSRPDLPPGPYTVLEVSDTGAGMRPDVLARVFDPFSTTNEPRQRAGLELAAVYGIAMQAGGHAEAESEVGKGSTFRVYLPAVLEAQCAVGRRHV